MSNLSQNSKTYFILNNTWNIFYHVFRIFGVYPCVRDEENGFKPRSTFCLWAHYICTILFANAIFIWIPVSYIAIVETTSNELIENLYDLYFRKGTTAVAMISNCAIFSYVGFICLHKLTNLSVGLSEFQNYYNDHAEVILNEKKITAHLKKHHFYALLYVLVFFCGQALFITFISIELKLNLNLSLVSTILHMFGTLIGILPYFVPIWYFLLIYFEIITFLAMWCDCVKNVQANNSLIKEAKIFINGLDLISNIFSKFLFWITSASLFWLVIMAYTTFDTFWDRNNFHFWQFHTIASMLLIISNIILLYGICTFSENMAEKVKMHYYK